MTILVVIGQRLLERDRAALYERFGLEREQGVEEAARGLASDVADIGEDLELASTLLQSAETTQLAERELHAIATIKREYMVIYARTATGETTKVSAYDAPPNAAALSNAILEELLADAERHPGELRSSSAYAPAQTRAGWFRAYARRPKTHGPTVAIVVDTAILLGRLRLERDSGTKIVVVDSRGATAPVSDDELARVVREQPQTFGPLIAATTTDNHQTVVIDGAVARSIGLAEEPAVALAMPLQLAGGRTWTLLVATSTSSLQAQETTIVRRVVLGGVLVLVLLLSAAAYVLHNMFRARSLRERVGHTEHLAHLNEKAEKILDHIPSGVLALAEDRRVTGVNRWLAERLGKTIIDRPLAEAFDADPADLARVTELVDRALATREPQALRDKLRLFGTEAFLDIHAVPLARGFGDVSVLLVVDDTTDLRRIEQRLLHSEKLVTAGQLAAGIAHEIGTPLNVARGRVELSLSHLGKDHAEAASQRVVIDQIDRVTKLLQQLLDYVRPAPIATQKIDVSRALRTVAELLAPQAAKRGVAIVVEASPLELHTDPDQVQQIVINLVLNAIDACSKGGRVTLRATSSPVVVEIVDDGTGIPAELQKHVFDPFFTTKKRGQGTGLGLWVVAQLVRAQAAEIELDSTVGRGTTVRITWPT